MEPIFPLHEERINQFCGQVVCAVMKDGSRYVGVLSSCKGGRLMLNDHPSDSSGHPGHAHHSYGADISAAKPEKKKNAKNRKKAAENTTAQTQAFYPYGPYPGYGPRPYYPFGPPLALELGLLAFLFLLL
ncbi:hypothetical protein [Paenibacillus sp. 1P07SE]|uniref:hypothetical protein n=1 Tax=Paenibacillus sp. 1P07SE TaxID=3132209 RepID=UPI0039A59597